MKKRVHYLSIAIGAVLMLSACSAAKETQVREAVQTTSAETTAEATERQSVAKESTSQESTSASEDLAKSLTADELAAYNTDLAVNYNGFFQTAFAAPEDIDWGVVFYDGTGFNVMTDEMKASIEQKTGYTFMTDAIAIKRSDVEEYMKKTTGLEVYEPTLPIDTLFVYDEELDVYFIEHGDSNYQEVKFTEGILEEDIVTLKYTYTTSDGSTEIHVVKVRIVQDGYQFISNIPEK